MWPSCRINRPHTVALRLSGWAQELSDANFPDHILSIICRVPPSKNSDPVPKIQCFGKTMVTNYTLSLFL